MDVDSGLKVMVVDDEPLLRMTAADILTERGFSVMEAGGGSEALRILETVTDLHALITDVNMPGDLDGVSLAHQVVAAFPGVGVVIVSGQTVPDQHTLPAGAVFLAKPYLPERLVATVRRVLRAA